MPDKQNILFLLHSKNPMQPIAENIKLFFQSFTSKEIKSFEKLPDKSGRRLYTINFRRVTSEAVNSIDYDPGLKIIEIEYKPGNIYHYLNMDKNTWDKFLEFADKGEGLGNYINHNFKKQVDDEGHDYYELNKT